MLFHCMDPCSKMVANLTRRPATIGAKPTGQSEGQITRYMKLTSAYKWFQQMMRMEFQASTYVPLKLSLGNVLPPFLFKCYTLFSAFNLNIPFYVYIFPSNLNFFLSVCIIFFFEREVVLFNFYEISQCHNLMSYNSVSLIYSMSTSNNEDRKISDYQ